MNETPYRIETETLVLRCFELHDDALRLQALQRSFEGVGPILGWREWPTFASVRAALRKRRAEFDLDRDRVFGVFSRAEDRLMGEVMLLIRAGHDAREIGVWTEPEMWGRGVAREAVAALIQVGFAYEGLKRLDYVCSVDNARSAGLATRLGFVREGLLRGRTIPSDPTPTDVYAHSLLAVEWAARPDLHSSVVVYDGFGERLSPREVAPAAGGARD